MLMLNLYTLLAQLINRRQTVANELSLIQSKSEIINFPWSCGFQNKQQ